MATTAIPYLLEDLMLVQAFMVSLHVPQLQGGDSVKTVLRELVPMSSVRELRNEPVVAAALGPLVQGWKWSPLNFVSPRSRKICCLRSRRGPPLLCQGKPRHFVCM